MFYFDNTKESRRMPQKPWTVQTILFFALFAVLISFLAPAPLNAREDGDDKEKESEAVVDIPPGANPFGEAAASEPEPGLASESAPEVVPEAGEVPVATLIFNRGKIDQVMAQLKRQTGVNVELKGKATDVQVNILAQKEPVDKILQNIANASKLVLVKVDNMNYKLMDEDTFNKTELPKQIIRKTFVLKYIKAEDARKALENVKTKNIGQIAADPRTNKLLVTDLPQVVELIKRLLDEIDVQLMTRVFYIRHADVQDIADKLKNYKSAPGTIDVDPKTHQIVVTDIFQNIKRMEMLVEVLDIGPEMRIYNLNNIGEKGSDAQQLTKAIEQVITKGADVFWQIDEKAGVLLVQDVPEVHEKVEKILAAFDQPIKQVLIYAELIDTNFNKGFDFGINWDASEDLFAAQRDGLFGETIPTGSLEDLTQDLGFINLAEEFPIISMTGSRIGGMYLNKYFRASLSTALSKSDTKILLQPRLIVKNQGTASIKVGGAKPYRTTNYYNNDTSDGWRTSGQSTVSYGLDVTFKPVISNNGTIELDVTMTNSDAQFIGDATKDPLVETTEVTAKSVLIIPSGETRVLAGLINNAKSNSREGIPILCEIPYLGPALFGSKSETDRRRNILFFITPTIIEESVRSKDFFRGKSLDEIIREGGEVPDFLAGLTTDTLVTATAEADSSDVLGLTSDQPFELKKLLGDTANLDAETLRQQRLEPMAGPDGSFSTDAPQTAEPAPPGISRRPIPGAPRTDTPPQEEPPSEEPPQPPQDQAPVETPDRRPSRPSTDGETQY